MARPDLSLILVTDPAMTAARGLVETVVQAAQGGVTIVQLRDKEASDEALISIARDLKRRLAPLGLPLLVNDRVAVARAAQADGVHLGQSDGDPAQARAELGGEALIGLSITHPDQAASVDPAIVDYVGLGPVFATASKPDATPPMGLGQLRALSRTLPVPVVAIGGIDETNAGAVAAAGAAGIAVVSAICAAPDPRLAAAALRRASMRGAA